MVGTDGLAVETVMKQSQIGRITYQDPGMVFVVDPQGIKGRKGQQQVPQGPLMDE